MKPKFDSAYISVLKGVDFLGKNRVSDFFQLFTPTIFGFRSNVGIVIVTFVY